jgi:hypothetical protein
MISLFCGTISEDIEKEKIMSKNAPAKKFKIGYVSCTIWKNDGTGDKPFYTVEISRTYRDADGNLKNTSSLNQDDLLNAAKLLERAEQYLAE